MRIAVFSDAHGSIVNIKRGLEKLAPVDQVLFAGDGIKELVTSDLASEFKLTAVKGNRDLTSSYPQKQIVEVASKRILLTHGHNYGVNKSLTGLYYQAQEVDAEVVVFGHTHRRYASRKDGILFFNPGSITAPRDSYPPSCGLIKIKESLDCKHYDIN